MLKVKVANVVRIEESRFSRRRRRSSCLVVGGRRVMIIFRDLVFIVLDGRPAEMLAFVDGTAVVGWGTF